jgi:Tfp pilus assembly PilM family ATPase
MNIRSLTRQPVVTVAIHRSAIRWSIGSRGRTNSTGTVPLAPHLIEDGVVTDPAAAAQALHEGGFAGTGRMQAVLALPAQRSVFRQLEAPALKGKSFSEMVDREIRREMPMLADNAYVSWTRAGLRGDQALVFVVGVARDVLDSHVATLQVAGLHVVSADLRIIAAARAVGEPDAIIANVEAEEVELGIFREGVPAIIRSVSMTGVPAESGWGEQLAEELARTLKFFRDSHRADDVVAGLPITFVGGAAREALLAPQVPAATGHDVALPRLRIRLNDEQETLVYAANAGMALKDLAA